MKETPCVSPALLLLKCCFFNRHFQTASQRGEVKWHGGDHDSNQWNWDFNVEEIPPNRETVSTKSATE